MHKLCARIDVIRRGGGQALVGRPVADLRLKEPTLKITGDAERYLPHDDNKDYNIFYSMSDNPALRPLS